MARRILVIDDHVAIRKGLSEILQETIPEVDFGEASDAQQALDQVRTAAWNVAVLDLNLPGRGGLDLICRSRRKTGPFWRVKRSHGVGYAMAFCRAEKAVGAACCYFLS